MNIGEYSPGPRLGEYLPMFTSPSASKFLIARTVHNHGPISLHRYGRLCLFVSHSRWFSLIYAGLQDY